MLVIALTAVWNLNVNSTMSTDARLLDGNSIRTESRHP